MCSGFSFARRTAVEFLSKAEDFSMNRSTLSSSRNRISIPISKAIDGFLKFKEAEGPSKRTITAYEFTLGHWLKYMGDREMSEIQASDLTGYMA